jgi:hypothetical protein
MKLLNDFFVVGVAFVSTAARLLLFHFVLLHGWFGT